jgi:hypothetical protein
VRIFLSYASEDRPTAERINFALIAHGHDVFFDREDLVAGQQFDAAIAQAIEASDLFVFLIAPESVERGRYTLSELQVAERRWPNPSAAVLPVLLRPTDRDAIAGYLRAVNWLEPRGEIGAEVAAAVGRLADALRSTRLRRWRAPAAASLALLVLAGLVAWTMWGRPGAIPSGEVTHKPQEAQHPIPAALRARARAVASTDGGYVLALTGPNELRRMTDDHQPAGGAVSLPGEPTIILENPAQYLVATSNTSAVTVLRRADLSEVMPIPFAVPSDAKVDVAPIVNSLAVERGVLWAATGDGGGPRALLKHKIQEWFVAQWSNGDHLRGDQPPWSTRPVRVVVVDSMLWAIAAPVLEDPAQLLRIMGAIRVDVVSDKDFAPIACASDIGDSSERNDGWMALLSCRDELLDVSADGTKLRLERTVPTNVRTAGERRVDERLVRSGLEVFAAMTMAGTAGDARRTVVVRVGASGAAVVGEIAGASVVSMAVSPRHVVTVVKRADGRFDVAVLPRIKETT